MTNLNPGIRRTVVWLNEVGGFRTTDSGDGKTHDYGCDRDHPYIVITVDKPEKFLVKEANRLHTVLLYRGIEVVPVGEGGPCIQASYDPVNEIGVIDLSNVDDALFFGDKND